MTEDNQEADLKLALKRQLRQAERTVLRLKILSVLATIGLLAWIGVQSRLAQEAQETAQSQLARMTEIARSQSTPTFEQLLNALRAGQQLKQRSPAVEVSDRLRVIINLHQALYSVREQNRLNGHLAGIWGVSFSPDGQLLASSSDDGTIKLWGRDGNLIRTILAHPAPVLSATFSPDGQIIASTSVDRTIKLWRLDGHPINTLTRYSGSVFTVQFSPNGQVLASSSDDKTIKLWTPDGRPIATLMDMKAVCLASSSAQMDTRSPLPVATKPCACGQPQLPKFQGFQGTLTPSAQLGLAPMVNRLHLLVLIKPFKCGSGMALRSQRCLKIVLL